MRDVHEDMSYLAGLAIRCITELAVMSEPDASVSATVASTVDWLVRIAVAAEKAADTAGVGDECGR